MVAVTFKNGFKGKTMNKRLFYLFGITIFFACNEEKGRKGASVSFAKQTLATEYISEGAAAGDVNGDGKMDVMSGSFWYEAPDWKRHEITTPYIHPSIDGYGNSFLNFSMDVNQDGWVDLIKIGFPGKETYWYENPQNKPGHWKERLLYHSVGNESPMLADIDGDGRPDLVCNDAVNKKVIWLQAPLSKGDTEWTAYTISNDSLLGTHHFTHGLGVGDMNMDGRPDVLIREGWWEAPPDPKQSNWVFHKADWGPECAQMYVMDVDGDGDQDVISSSAHEYGIWWYEQIKETNGSVTWKQHEIYKEFSQSHGMKMVDINGDGYPDLVTGKRFWAHNGGDPGERDPAVIYWFEFVPGAQPQWIPRRIDDNSGVGLHVTAQDMNNDGMLDLIIGNKKGVFVFEQLKPENQ